MADSSDSDGDTSSSADLHTKRKYTRRKQPEERKKRGPRTKDQNAPRLPLNGYVRFLNANRDRIKQESPDLSFAEVTKKLAAEWGNMTTDEKKIYLDEAEKAKEMYMKELQEYQQTDSYQEFQIQKQRAKQQQQQPPMMQASSMASSQSPMQMQMPGQMYPGSNQQYYAAETSSAHQGMHSGQFSSTYQQAPQQMYPYGMNGGGGKMASSMPGINATTVPYSQQQQYYPSSSHSSVASEYGNLSGSNQYTPHFHPQYVNPTNGVASYNMTASSANSMEMNGPMSIQGNGLSGSNSLSAVLDKCNSVMDLPIFTEEFLEHNKMREQELRNVRALSMEFEEENAILSKHVDDMNAATEKLIQDELKERETNTRLKAMLEKLQQNLVDKFQDVNLPQSYMPPYGQFQQMNGGENVNSQFYRPSMDNIGYYVDGLDQAFRAQALPNGGEPAPLNNCKSEPLVQSIQKAISGLDEVTFV